MAAEEIFKQRIIENFPKINGRHQTRIHETERTLIKAN